MTLQQFGLTAEQKLMRKDGIGGSDANVIMGGDQAAILHLWQVKTGQAEDENLDDVLPVQMGLVTEALNRHWYTKETGNVVSCAGELVLHPTHTFMRCNLDGRVDAERAIFEAKHVNAFAKPEEVAQKYMGQLHHNMAVCGLERAVLSVFLGTFRYEHFIVESDPFYLASLIEAEGIFWDSVQTMTPPPVLEFGASPALPEQFVKVDMTGQNDWASLAADWKLHKLHSKTFTTAKDGLKELMTNIEGHEAFGYGVRACRAKNGAITIREMKDA